MAGDRREARVTRVEPFFEPLIGRDASGRSWLPALLAAAPGARGRFGDLLDDPGSLVTPLSVRTVHGRLGCFEYPVAPPRELLAWFIDHPRALVWPAGATLSAEATRLRRALLLDDPPGAQPRAQDRARELLATRSLLSEEWWQFETISRLPCVLITMRLVVTVVVAPLGPPTPWYPQRSELVRALDAARTLADGKPWGTLLLSERPVEGDSHEHLGRILPAAAPHLEAKARAETATAYLGNLTWRAACEAVGVPLGALPDVLSSSRAG